MSEVRLRRKVTLKHKNSVAPDSSNSTPVVGDSDSSDTNNNSSSNRSKIWLWILLGVVLLLLVLWLVFGTKSCSNESKDDAEISEQAQNEQVPTNEQSVAPSAIEFEQVSSPSEANAQENQTPSNASNEESHIEVAVSDPVADEHSNIQHTETVSNNDELDNSSKSYSVKDDVNDVTNSDIFDDIEAEAKNVIRGKYGNGKVRRDRLGERYRSIQKLVNEMKKQGLF